MPSRRRPDIDVLALNDALKELEILDPMQGRIVELRYFSGLSIPETAEATGVSESTVKREWIVAKTWIRRRLLEGKNLLTADDWRNAKDLFSSAVDLADAEREPFLQSQSLFIRDPLRKLAPS